MLSTAVRAATTLPTTQPIRRISQSRNDTFVFAHGGGHDTITDFIAGQDLANVADFGLSASAIQSLINSSSGDTISFASGESLTFNGINVATQLHTSDFILL
jgi:hypothetical protein